MRQHISARVSYKSVVIRNGPLPGAATKSWLVRRRKIPKQDGGPHGLRIN
jgi:hypothetical protein